MIVAILVAARALWTRLRCWLSRSVAASSTDDREVLGEHNARTAIVVKARDAGEAGATRARAETSERLEREPRSAEVRATLARIRRRPR